MNNACGNAEQAHACEMTSKHSAGGFARAAALPPDRRRLIASAAARARWGDKTIDPGKTHIYVIGPAAGPLKVGLARNPLARRSDLQVGNHQEISIHHAALIEKEQSRDVEAYAHWLLGDASKGGEWFSADIAEAVAAVTNAISAVLAGERSPKRPARVTARQKRPKMIFDLTDADREALEAHRIRLGLRSHAETLRALIRGDDATPAMAAPPTPSPSFSHGRSKTVVSPTEKQARMAVVAAAQRATVPTYERKAFNPQPKKGR